MAISFASAVGNLNNRIGRLGALLVNLRNYQNTQLSKMTNTTTGVVAQYNAESDLQAIVGGNYISELNIPESIGSMVQSAAIQTINRVVYRDRAINGQTLTQVNLLGSLQDVILQMKQQGASVQACTVGATTAAFTGTGNGAVNVSTRRPSDGLVVENTIAETVTITCTSDSYIGGSTEGNEGFTATGQGSQTDVFAFNYPLGSNCVLGLNAIDGSQDNNAGNLLTNSSWEDWTSNVPDNWTLVAGAAGTNIVRSTTAYDGAYAVECAGDGTTNFNITQTFDLSAGTLGELSPLTQYGFNMWWRRDGVAAGSGVMTIDLIDGSNNIIQDANSQNNTFTVDLTALTATYTAYQGVFRTPLVLPSTIKIRIRLTTALTAGRSVFFDRGSLGIMQRLYVGGPAVCVYSGSVPFRGGDYSLLTLTNNLGGGSTPYSSFQPLYNILFGMLQSNLLLPSSASSPTISDSLIG